MYTEIYRIEPGPVGSGVAHLRRLAGGYVCNVVPVFPTDTDALAAELLPARAVEFVHELPRGAKGPLYIRVERTGYSFWERVPACERCARNGEPDALRLPHAPECERGKAYAAEAAADERRYHERLNRGVLTVTSADND